MQDIEGKLLNSPWSGCDETETVTADGNSRYRAKVCLHLSAPSRAKKSGTAEDQIFIRLFRLFTVIVDNTETEESFCYFTGSYL